MMDDKNRFEEHKEGRKTLLEAFKTKGIVSTAEKRAILQTVLGHTPTFTSITIQEQQKVIAFLEGTPHKEAAEREIAWLYMIPAENGLTPAQLTRLIKQIPAETEVIPFHNDVRQLLESNSIAMGFLDTEHVEYQEEVENVSASVCNDWGNEIPGDVYPLSNGRSIRIIRDYSSILL